MLFIDNERMVSAACSLDFSAVFFLYAKTQLLFFGGKLSDREINTSRVD
jgi:hypothetical protein